MAGHPAVPAQSLLSRPLLLQGHSSLLSTALLLSGYSSSYHGRVKGSNSNTQRLLKQKCDWLIRFWVHGRDSQWDQECFGAVDLPSQLCPYSTCLQISRGELALEMISLQGMAWLAAVVPGRKPAICHRKWRNKNVQARKQQCNIFRSVQEAECAVWDSRKPKGEKKVCNIALLA